MKRVLIYRNELLPASETFIASQALALTRYSPWFVGLRRIIPGFHIDETKISSLTHTGYLKDKIARHLYLHTHYAPFFHRELQRLDASIIHAHFAVDGGMAVALSQRLRIPLVVTLHGYDVTRNDEAMADTVEGRAYLRTRSALLQHAALFLCVSRHIYRRAVQRGFPRERLTVLPIGIALPEAEFAARDQEDAQPTVLFVGRMVEKKGCTYLLRAMERVEAQLPNARLVLLGDGPLRLGLEAAAKERLRNVRFLGMRPPCEVREWMQRAHVLAAPSIAGSDGDTEGLPIVLCEAQAMGLPVVTFHGPGVEEAVEADQTALVVPTKDEEALAEAMLRLLKDNLLRREFAEAGWLRAMEHFDIQKQTMLLEQTYDEVVARDRQARGYVHTAAGS